MIGENMGKFKIITDETLRETIQHGTQRYPLAYYFEDIWQFDFHCIDWHWHQSLEFVYVSKGTATVLIGTDKLQLEQGYGIFINSGILHRFEAKSNTIIPNIVFSPILLAPENSLLYEKYILPVITSSLAWKIFDPQIAWQNEIINLLLKLFSLQEEQVKNELQSTTLLLNIWDILFQNTDFIAKDNPLFYYLNHQQAKLQTMMQYIFDHYVEDLDLLKIANSASISKSSALQIFKSNIHLSPVSFLIQHRLTQAAELLSSTEKNILTIAMETGFSDTGYFCRKFKQVYHQTPSEYRKDKTFTV